MSALIGQMRSRATATLRGISSPVTSFPRRSVLKITDLSKPEVEQVLNIAACIKQDPSVAANLFKQRSLIMLFEKPSLRTRLSFEIGMTQMGGHGVFYSVADSPLGKKESIEDTAQVMSRYADLIMARLNKREDIGKLAEHAAVPVINALDDYAHPCQVLADFQTIVERRPEQFGTSLKGLTFSYVGDVANNMTYDLMRGGILMGMHVKVGGPEGDEYQIEPSVIDECNELAKADGAGSFEVSHDPEKSVEHADIIYADTFQSYHLDPAQEVQRSKDLAPFQVSEAFMSKAKSNSIFMHCLPAMRGVEVTKGVIDGPQSVIFDQAENRLHAQKALMLWLMQHKIGAFEFS